MSDPGADAEHAATDPGGAATVRARYSEGEATWRARTAEGQRLEDRLSNARLAVFAIGLVLGWFVFGVRQIAWPWMLLPVVAFVTLAILHDRAIRRRTRAERAAAFFADGLARLDGAWAGRGQAGDAFLDPRHPYAGDLDLFGRGSLFELLCRAELPIGAKKLAAWLCAPAEPATVRARQEAVASLAPRLDLRLDLAVAGHENAYRLEPERLVAWGESEPVGLGRGYAWIAGGLSALGLVGAYLWIKTGAGPIPLLFVFAIQAGFGAVVRSRVAPVLKRAAAPSEGLAVLADLLVRYEAEHFDTPHLRALREALATGGIPPSKRIESLRRLIDLRDARRNQFFAPIGGWLMWGTQVAVALERWRDTCGTRLRGWLEAVAELEALGSLAGHAFEHPDDVFPEIVEGEPVFEGRGLGHPLLLEGACVRNDLALGGDVRGLVMSGSNMSGKSTMLRTVGTNTVLALAGAPVRAESLRLSSLQVAASIRIVDSLQEGASHFYAEITRLRQVVDLARGERPCLFLLDEILHGTNSHDRRIGAEAVVKGLIEAGALGIVTTHDLALARIAEAEGSRMKNVHFQDELVEGRMHFDYRLQAGVVTRSNAIELMRSVGLDV